MNETLIQPSIDWDNKTTIEDNFYEPSHWLDEQKLRENLIQRATTRLRSRLLEQGLQDVMRQVVSLQTEIESIRLDAAATLDQVTNLVLDDSKSTEATQKLNRQMDILERRLANHKASLSQINSPPPVKPTPKPEADAMSRLSSLSLSIFSRGSTSSSCDTSSCATSVVEDHPFYDLAGKKSFGAGSFCGSVYQQEDEDEVESVSIGRMMSPPFMSSTEARQKRRQRRQRYKSQLDQLSQVDDSDSDLSSACSSCSSEYRHVQPTLMDHQPFSNVQPWLSSMVEEDLFKSSLYPERNILDETMSFLDGLSEDDGGFGEDIYLLLRNPDLCCRPLSEIETTMDQLRQKQNLSLFKPSTWLQFGMKYSGALAYEATCNSLEWCRFLSVLSAAVVISVMKGPQDMKRTPIQAF